MIRRPGTRLWRRVRVQDRGRAFDEGQQSVDEPSGNKASHTLPYVTVKLIKLGLRIRVINNAVNHL